MTEPPAPLRSLGGRAGRRPANALACGEHLEDGLARDRDDRRRGSGWRAADRPDRRRRSGPRRIGTLAKRLPPKSGLAPEATSISPLDARAATAHEVGPWISRPLRSAIPPRRRTSRSLGPPPLAEAPLLEISTVSGMGAG